MLRKVFKINYAHLANNIRKMLSHSKNTKENNPMYGFMRFLKAVLCEAEQTNCGPFFSLKLQVIYNDIKQDKYKLCKRIAIF